MDIVYSDKICEFVKILKAYAISRKFNIAFPSQKALLEIFFLKHDVWFFHRVNCHCYSLQIHDPKKSSIQFNDVLINGESVARSEKKHFTMPLILSFSNQLWISLFAEENGNISEVKQ